MDSKKELKRLVDIVITCTAKSQEQLAIDMGYGKNYISDSLSPTGKVSTKFLGAFERHYQRYIDNPGIRLMYAESFNNDTVVEDPGTNKNKYTAALEAQVRLQEEVKQLIKQVQERDKKISELERFIEELKPSSETRQVPAGNTRKKVGVQSQKRKFGDIKESPHQASGKGNTPSKGNRNKE